MTAVAPRVIRHPDLKPIVHSVACKPQYFGQLMLAGGMSADQIQDITMVFSADEGREEGYDGVVTNGHYQHDARQITINLGRYADVSHAQEQLSELPPSQRRPYVELIANKRNEMITETGLHEVRHAIDYHVIPDEQLTEERERHWHNTFKRRNSRSELLGLVAGASLLGVTAEMFTMTDPKLLESSLIGTLGVGSVAAMFTARLAHQASSARWSHRDYLARPWEVRAREYGKAQLEALKKANRSLPIRVNYKAVEALASF